MRFGIFRRVGMDGNEQVRAQLARDAIAFLKHEEFVVVAGQRHAHPAGFDQLIANRLGDGQRDVLFPLAIFLVDGARIMAAMARIDHHQRAGAVMRALHRRQRHAARGGRDRHGDGMDALLRTGGHVDRPVEPGASLAHFAAEARVADALEREAERFAVLRQPGIAERRGRRQVQHHTRRAVAQLPLTHRGDIAPARRKLETAHLCAVDIERDAARRVQQERRCAIHPAIESHDDIVVPHIDAGDAARASGCRRNDHACQGKALEHALLVQRTAFGRPANFHDDVPS